MNTKWSVEDDFEDILDIANVVSVGKLPSVIPESNEVALAVTRFMKIVFNKLKKRNYPHLDFKPRLMGSMAEGTKVYQPNEFDFICELIQADYKGINVELTEKGGYIVGQSIVDSPILHHNAKTDSLITRDQRHSDPRLVTRQFQSNINAVLNSMANENATFTNLVLHKSALEPRDKASSIHLLWNGEVFKNTMIYIHIVLACVLPADFKPIKTLPLQTKGKPYHLIAKKSRHNFSEEKEECLYSFSFALQENQFIRNLPTNIRNGYVRAKSVRIAAISRPRNMTGIVLEEDEKVDSDEYIKTYMLKTCLFFLYDEHKDDDITLALDEFEWALMIYKKLVEFIEQRKLQTFYGDGVLFQCGHPADDRNNRICCQMRLVILRMCDAIMTWLREHSAEVQEMDELYPECRLEVYNGSSQQGAFKYPFAEASRKVPGKSKDFTPDICVASANGKVDDMKLLLDCEQAITSDTNGWNALHHAAANGHDEIVELLINRGYDVKARTNSGDSALHLAAINSNYIVLDILLNLLENETSSEGSEC